MEDLNYIRVPVGIMQLRTEEDLAAIPPLVEHLTDDLSWLIIYRVEGQFCQEFFGGHMWSSIRDTIQSRVMMSETSVTLILTSANIIDVESFSRTDWADSIDIDVVDSDSGDTLIPDDEIDLPHEFPPSKEVRDAQNGRLSP